MIRYKFTEADKSRFIDMANITDNEKKIVKEFFSLHPEQEKYVDWNKRENLSMDDFFPVIKAFNERKLPKLTLSDLKEGVDYEYLGQDNYYKYYFILSYKGSVTIASNNVEPEVWTSGYGRGYDTAISLGENSLIDYPTRVEKDGLVLKGGAKWCTAYNHTNSMWKSYTDEGSSFIYACAIDKSLKHYQKVAVRLEYSDTQEMYNEADMKFTSGKVYNIIYKYIESIDNKVKELEDKFIDIRNYEKRKKEQERQDYINSLPRINLEYKGYDFPMVKMGHRTEGDVYGSLYLTSDLVPYSPAYEGDKYKYGCNRWDISIVRQWLNSDEPAGKWFKEYEVEGYKVDWKNTPDSTKNFIQNTDGFLKIVGLSKSQLTPVKNITYTTEGEAIITEDYVWIPSLSELSTQSNYKEGEPLEYWKKLLGDNADTITNENRTIKNCDTLRNAWYWTRSSSSSYANDVGDINYDGSVSWDDACYWFRMPVLACLKSN